MRLAFVMEPVHDLDSAVAAWRALGLEELWSPDSETTILGAGGRASVMVEDHPAEHRLGRGPVFIVDDVEDWKRKHEPREWVIPPCDVPMGRYAAFRGDHGGAVRLLDLTAAEPDVPHFSLSIWPRWWRSRARCLGGVAGGGDLQEFEHLSVQGTQFWVEGLDGLAVVV